MAESRFAPAVGAWSAGLGRLRDVVRQEVLVDQLRAVLGAPRPGATVLDVGCGQGTQAIQLARAGHRVVGLDLSEDLLERFEVSLAAEPPDVAERVRLVHAEASTAHNLPGAPFEVVLCHGVLMYVDDLADFAKSLSAAAGDPGTLSLLVRNGLAPAMRDGLLGNASDALRAFDSLEYVNRLGIAAKAHTPELLDSKFVPLGWRRDCWYGVRVFTDHRDEDAPSMEVLAPMLRAEAEAGRRDPYRQVAALLHVVYRRGAETPGAGTVAVELG